MEMMDSVAQGSKDKIEKGVFSMNDKGLQVFNFEKKDVRVVMKSDTPWWVAKDVCDILELNNITEALRGLDSDELATAILKSGGQGREMRLISESGLYTLIMRSNKPEARRFRKWVTSEVLPTWRGETYVHYRPFVSQKGLSFINQLLLKSGHLPPLKEGE